MYVRFFLSIENTTDERDVIFNFKMFQYGYYNIINNNFFNL